MSLQHQPAGGNRRDFLRNGLRYTLLGGVAAAVGTLAARSGQTCVNEGICRGCAAFDDCVLPQAASAKQVLKNAHAAPSL